MMRKLAPQTAGLKPIEIGNVDRVIVPNKLKTMTCEVLYIGRLIRLEFNRNKIKQTLDHSSEVKNAKTHHVSSTKYNYIFS